MASADVTAGAGLNAGWAFLVGGIGLIVTLFVLYNLARGG